MYRQTANLRVTSRQLIYFALIKKINLILTYYDTLPTWQSLRYKFLLYTNYIYKKN